MKTRGPIPGPVKGGQPDPPTPTGQMVADAVDATTSASSQQKHKGG
jgi:hypothetical protein